VLPGTPVARWVDCQALLVDVPVSDIEVSLIVPGQRASVVLEGEGRSREGTVLLTRGSAATLDDGELAATAKGRDPGTAQVLLTLPHEPREFESCPVGRAAFVDFPGVGLVDIVLARLRL